MVDTMLTVEKRHIEDMMPKVKTTPMVYNRPMGDTMPMLDTMPMVYTTPMVDIEHRHHVHCGKHV